VSEFESTAAQHRLAANRRRAEFGERDVDDVQRRVRDTVRRCFPTVLEPAEIEDLVQQGCLIVEEALREVPIAESFRRAIAARLTNGLYDYWRQQHPEFRRNTREQRRAAERGEEYVTKIYQATGLGEGLVATAADPALEAYDQMIRGITSARELMTDPQKAGLPFGVASYHVLATGRANRAYERLEDLRLERTRPGPFNYLRNL
jgi:DNA-directed RNA polymerase specialized sigma24 family protein